MPRSVLLVDDDPLSRLVLRKALEQADYRVDEAADGYAAISLAAALEPDFVILDQMMPLLDGTDALPAIKATSPATVVVLYTSLDSVELEQHALAQGAAGLVNKQRPLEALIDLLDELSQ
jgi:CheY-like chemotaxis protein